MERIKFIQYKSKDIFLTDYSNLAADEVAPLMEKSAEIIQSQPKNSVLELINLTNMGYNMTARTKFKTIPVENNPYIKKTAVVGVTGGLQQVMVNDAARKSGREFPVFDSIEAAKEYLIEE